MKSTVISIVGAGLLIGGAILFTGGGGGAGAATAPAGNNVSIVDGKQVIEIQAKGNYSPRTSTAKAGIPSVLRVETNGTFDCTSVVRIPSMDIAQNLPPSGTTEIDLGSPTVATLQGTCAMGMYNFSINFI